MKNCLINPPVVEADYMVLLRDVSIIITDQMKGIMVTDVVSFTMVPLMVVKNIPGDPHIAPQMVVMVTLLRLLGKMVIMRKFPPGLGQGPGAVYAHHDLHGG